MSEDRVIGPSLAAYSVMLGLVPNVALEVDTIETAKRMVERGLGLAFLPLIAVGPEVRRGELATVRW